ncbi:hypothetical protein MNBD_CHLOROFLEXI01-4118 [hydrothermal vent metagenome]|uniref:Uncharacterized protein n=1 Tax=hydrothermal vent metagenome TaxID=652676 RepID=A0A3B0UIE4_9ZZZZ
MSIDSKDAEKSLHLIKQAQTAQEAVGAAEVGCFLLIWGIVWLIGFLMSHYAPASWLLWSWLLLCLLGSAFSAVVGIRLGQQVQYRQTGSKLGLFYPALLGFSLLWLYLARPMSWQQTAVLSITFLGFATVVNGILLKERVLAAVGLASTVLAVVVYLWLLPQFGLIMGIVGGGGMILAGLRFLLAGRPDE